MDMQEAMMMDLDAAIAYAKAHQAEFLDDLQAFLRIPSISTLPDHKQDMEQAAQWVAEHLKAYGFDSVSVMPTGGHPSG